MGTHVPNVGLTASATGKRLLGRGRAFTSYGDTRTREALLTERGREPGGNSAETSTHIRKRKVCKALKQVYRYLKVCMTRMQ